MTGHQSSAPTPEGSLPPSHDTPDPETRFAKSLALVVLVATVCVEGFQTVAAVVLLHPTTALVHGGLTLVAIFVVASGRWLGFQRWLSALGIVAIGLTSSIVNVTSGFGLGVLLWHFVLPTAVLLVAGPRWGLVVLGFDVVQAVVEQVYFLDALAFRPGSPRTLLIPGAELLAVLTFAAFFVFLRLIHQCLALYRAEKREALTVLAQAKDSEGKWANQVRLLETLMDVIPFPLFHKGADGRYLTVNDSFCVVFDVHKPAVTGQKSDDFLQPENAKTLAKIELDVLARDSMAVEESVLIHADGQPHNFIVYLVPFVDGAQAIHGSIGVLIDITERKLREGKLVQLNATKDQLFSIISHDLRGPVGKLKQLLDIYIDDPSIFDKATWDQVFHDMRRSTDSLFQLLENLLSWARAQQGQDHIRYEAIPLEPVIGDVFSVLKLLANDKKITLEMDLHLNGPLLTDRHTLSTILRNLVHNALKFTMPGGKITVTARETPADLWIEVKDTGVGMPEETVRRIFQQRERVTTYGTGKERGQGIGIGLCRDLADTLGAHLEAESHVGTGTAIRLHLPTPEL